MAKQRRSLSKAFILSDVFLALPLEVRWLYIVLVLHADDDGFVLNPGSVLLLCKVGEEEMQALVTAGLVIPFPAGPVLIAHWLLHNRVRPDRYLPSPMKDQLSLVTLGEDRVYRRKEEKQKPARFQKPTLEEVRSFIRERGFSVDADAWYTHYESNGWMVGKNHMKDWRASVNYWEHNKTMKKGSDRNNRDPHKNAFFPYQPQWYGGDDLLSSG